MAHVTSLAQHILSLEPDKDAARLSFYHYLKNLCAANDLVNAELLNRFYFRALTFAHWQGSKAHLFNEVSALLQHFQDANQESLPLDGIVSADDLQIVPIESPRNFELILEKHLTASRAPYDQFRILPVSESAGHFPGQFIAVTLRRDRGLRVAVFPTIAMIINGELSPLCQDFTLHYGSDLSLIPGVPQEIDLGQHAAAHFQVTTEGIFGTVVRGYTFQKYAALEGGGLHKYPVLFYPLKRLEQFFVDRKSDPMYIELTNLLEKSLELMNQRHPEAMKFATAALERGKLALEYIFPDDRLVRLLINNLEKTVALELASRSAAGTSRSAPTLQRHSRQNSQTQFTDTADDSVDESWPHATQTTRGPHL